ncbi:hypothetical protein LAZ67_1001697 [Cordylochernes scorpioides]|uniref:Mos1 transposase HTH domain-containing protein n=1 Tax=Cordylochernes scorpioides TaxID=51811 RepID=A0ABY6JX09_9ARAC|nr:hypothetical protein LAZ67_1001697 [Cordylochernes scorpioides]
MEYPGGKNLHFRHLLFFAFHQGQKAAKAARDICSVYGKGPVEGRWSPNNHELAEKIKCSAVTISNHLQSIVPNKLNETNKENHLQIAAQHLARHQSTQGHKQQFLCRIVTGDEKLCLYVKQRKEWVAPGDMPKSRIKQDLHLQKAMNCVFWDCEGVLYWEMLERNATVNTDLYIAQLHRVNEAIQQKRPNRQGQIILLHDNARPHVAQVIKAALQELEWEVLQHSSYSPDLAPTDYHLFRSFDDEEDLKTWLNNFFGTRPVNFWRKGINKLVEHWEEAVAAELTVCRTALSSYSLQDSALQEPSPIQHFPLSCPDLQHPDAMDSDTPPSTDSGSYDRAIRQAIEESEDVTEGGLDRLRFLPIKKMDQRTCIKFCVKNEIKCADAFRMLTVAYREATLDRSNVYRWYKMFSEGREDVNNEERAGRPSTSTTDEKINEVEKIILANRRITVREVAEDLNISIGSCHSIFINDLGMRRVAGKFVPKLLNCDQKQHRMNIANEMLDSVRNDPNLLQRVITGDKAWVYGYDVETKAQSSQWKLPHEPRPKKARQVRLNVKVLLTVFFDCSGVVHHEFLPQGRTVNKEYYLQVMRNLCEAIRQKRPDLWKNKNWLLHHDNALLTHRCLCATFWPKTTH